MKEETTVMKDERIKISHYNSAGIRAFARSVGARYMEPVAVYGHGDATVSFFRLIPGGELVADTNGDPLLGDEAEEELERLRREEEGMSLTQGLIDAFGPGVPMREIAAAIWYYTRSELAEIIRQVDTDIAWACQRLTAAREQADRELGPGWQVIKTIDGKLSWQVEKQLWDLDLECGTDGTEAYWLVPASKLKQVQELLEA